MTVVAGDVAECDTPLRAVFQIKVNGRTVSITTVGQAYRFITSFSSVEWIEFRALHADAVHALQRAADNDGAGDRRAACAVRPRQTAVSPRCP